MTFQRLAFGAHDPEIVLVLELGLHCSSRALDSDKTFQPREGWDLPSPAAAHARQPNEKADPCSGSSDCP
jgi:hypothetical protein